MQIWNYHPVTGELVGHSFADPHPIEEGEWLIPAYATTTAPGAPQAGHAYQFVGNGWTIVADHRGEVWWKADAKLNTAPVVIDFIGDPALQGLTQVEPPAPPLVVSAWQIRKALSRLGLRAAVESYIAAADQDTKDGWQFAPEFERDNGMIAIAAADLGKTPEEIDALFALAKTL